MEIFGKSPVLLPVLILGKLCFTVCLVFIVLQFFNNQIAWLHFEWLKIPSLIMIISGTIISMVSLLHLGESARVGLPTGHTRLKTRGLYRFSRNPIYLGLFLVCTGSALYCIHPVNIIAAVTALFIHHFVILKEETFLENRFGEEWKVYKTKVRRYF